MQWEMRCGFLVNLFASSGKDERSKRCPCASVPIYLSNSDFCPLEISPNLTIEDKALLKHDQHSPRCFSLRSFNEDQSFKVGYPNVGKSSLFNAFVGRIRRKKLTKESIFFEEV